MTQASSLKINEENNASVRSRSDKNGQEIKKLFDILHQDESEPFFNKNMTNNSSYSSDSTAVLVPRDDKILLFEPNIVSRRHWCLANSNCTQELKRHRGKRYSKVRFGAFVSLPFSLLIFINK